MAKRLVKHLSEDYLSCTVCLEQYTTPKTLPCEHAFCEQCLVNHVTQTITRASFQCPVCRDAIIVDDQYVCDVERWVRDLPTDSLLTSLLQTISRHQTAKSDEFEYSGVNACSNHEGKQRDVYCFTHAKLICWECAGREHRNCSIDSVANAGHVIKPMIESLKIRVDKHLRQSRDLCKNDQQFTESKTETIAGLDKLEKDLDTTFASAKKQIVLLREEVELHNKTHLDERKGFYDLVTFLLEMNNTLDTMKQSDDIASAVSVLNKLNEGVNIADKKMAAVESSADTSNISKMSFVLDDDVDTFLKSYASVGFINTCDKAQGRDPDEIGAPLSISHILRRPIAHS